MSFAVANSVINRKMHIKKSSKDEHENNENEVDECYPEYLTNLSLPIGILSPLFILKHDYSKRLFSGFM